LIIALDYDGTFTEDEVLWSNFILHCRNRGHRIIIVTMRYESEEIGRNVESGKDVKWLIGADNVFFTSRMAKKPFMERLGIHVNIWIDDHPQAVFLDAEKIWGNVTSEGNPSSTNAVEV
jgi:hypothetical protein